MESFDNGQGLRFFKCEKCRAEYNERADNHLDQTWAACPMCQLLNGPYGAEFHPEWPVDGNGKIFKEA